MKTSLYFFKSFAEKTSANDVNFLVKESIAFFYNKYAYFILKKRFPSFFFGFLCWHWLSLFFKFSVNNEDGWTYLIWLLSFETYFFSIL